MNEVLLWGALSIALVAALWDIRTRKIPNAVCLVLALTSFAWSASSTPHLMGALIHFAIALGIGFLLFSFRWIGGGDAKFYAACALALPLSSGFAMLFFTSISGLVLVAILVALRLSRRARSPRSTWKRLQIPYGAAIFIGFAATTTTSFIAN